MHVDEFYKKSLDFLTDYVPFYKDKVFVAGGFFPRFYHGLPLRDIDVYVSKDILSDILSEYTRMSAFDVPVQQTEDGLFFSVPVKGKDFSVEIIAFHEPQDVSFVKGFDFLHCSYAVEGPTDRQQRWSNALAYSFIETKVITVNEKFSFKDNLKRFENYIPKKQLIHSLTEDSGELIEYQPTKEEKEFMRKDFMHAAYAKTFMRLQKYIQMGFTIHETQMAYLVEKMMEEE